MLLNAEAKSNDKAKSNDEETKPVPTSFNWKIMICKIQNFYISLGF